VELTVDDVWQIADAGNQELQCSRTAQRFLLCYCQQFGLSSAGQRSTTNTPIFMRLIELTQIQKMWRWHRHLTRISQVIDNFIYSTVRK